VELTGAKRDGDNIAYQAAFGLPFACPEHIHLVIISQAHAAPSIRQQPNDVTRHGDGVLPGRCVLRC